LFHGRIITIVERIPSSQRRGGAKRKRDSAQPQEKGEASIEVRRNRWNAGLITITASRYRARLRRSGGFATILNGGLPSSARRGIYLDEAKVQGYDFRSCGIIRYAYGGFQCDSDLTV